MHADTMRSGSQVFSGQNAVQILSVFKDAVGAKSGPVCHRQDLPHAKELIKLALFKLIQDSDDICAKSELSMLYLSLAEFQDFNMGDGPDARGEAITEESRALLDDLRRLERGA